MKKICCDICDSEMTDEIKRLPFLLQGEVYHGDTLIYHCNVCGFEKLGTCEVKFWENDEPIESTEEKGITEKKYLFKPKMLEMYHGKVRVTDEWLDWMLENKPWFLFIFYNKFVSRRRQEKRYLSQQAPTFKAILNNVLFDTANSIMFLMDEKDFGFGNELCRKYYYMTQSGKYFAVVVQLGKANEIITMDLKDVKKLLALKPDIYKEVIPEEVVE